MSDKISVLKNNEDFQFILKKGKKISNNTFLIYSYPSSSFAFGIAVGKKSGNAVARNKIKRQIRQLVKLNETLLIKVKKNIIIFTKDNYLKQNYEFAKKEFNNLVTKI